MLLCVPLLASGLLLLDGLRPAVRPPLPWLSAILGRGVAARADGPALRFPLRFDAEVIHLYVEEDSLRVEGLYELVARQGREVLPAAARARGLPLSYPYPRGDPRLGRARTLELAIRDADGAWSPLEYQELPESIGVRWWVPLPEEAGDTLRVRTVYRQARHAPYARYIVTTTRAWGEPLRDARFLVHLPPGTQGIEWSHPFEALGDSSAATYEYRAERFWPERDIEVTWRE